MYVKIPIVQSTNVSSTNVVMIGLYNYLIFFLLLCMPVLYTYAPHFLFVKFAHCLIFRSTPPSDRSRFVQLNERDFCSAIGVDAAGDECFFTDEMAYGPTFMSCIV